MRPASEGGHEEPQRASGEAGYPLIHALKRLLWLLGSRTPGRQSTYERRCQFKIGMVTVEMIGMVCSRGPVVEQVGKKGVRIATWGFGLSNEK